VNTRLWRRVLIAGNTRALSSLECKRFFEVYFNCKLHYFRKLRWTFVHMHIIWYQYHFLGLLERSRHLSTMHALLCGGIMSLNHNEYKLMNVIPNYNDKNIGCALLEFQRANIHARTAVCEAVVISASLGSAYFVALTCFYNKVDCNYVAETRQKIYNRQYELHKNLSLFRFYRCNTKCWYEQFWKFEASANYWGCCSRPQKNSSATHGLGITAL